MILSILCFSYRINSQPVYTLALGWFGVVVRKVIGTLRLTSVVSVPEATILPVQMEWYWNRWLRKLFCWLKTDRKGDIIGKEEGSVWYERLLRRICIWANFFSSLLCYQISNFFVTIIKWDYHQILSRITLAKKKLPWSREKQNLSISPTYIISELTRRHVN